MVRLKALIMDKELLWVTFSLYNKKSPLELTISCMHKKY